MYTQLYGVPLHAEYVKVHVFVPPLHGGSADGTPADGAIGRLQLSNTVGGVGAVAFETHATADIPPEGKVTVGAEIVYVYTQLYVVPSQATYGNVHVFVPAHNGSAPATPAPGVIVRPQLSITGGGAGATASDGHATVEEPAGGNVTVGGLIVYVNTYVNVLLSQRVYVNVQVLVPTQSGSDEGTPAEGDNIFPQLSVTFGAIGATANPGQATVEEAGAGGLATGGVMVYVKTHGYVEPSHAVYVNVHVFVPPQVGSILATPAETVSVRLQLSVTVGGVGAVAFAGHATVAEPPAGMLTTGGLIV